MYSKLFYKYTVHVKLGKIIHRKRCVHSPTVEVTLYSYYKYYAKNRSHKLTVHF